ncbi:hypothetical protein NDU88_005240 [Pleurodeles waltl]|uniref:Uncharacterized protein n=1 Tax=Pleurodeles waltl TaxID=8319 RepID=A0AAV7PI03_PLEWA|nr:hypothetical protein NDU88_005240 [Pleurodeles waltl]
MPWGPRRVSMAFIAPQGTRDPGLFRGLSPLGARVLVVPGEGEPSVPTVSGLRDLVKRVHVCQGPCLSSSSPPRGRVRGQSRWMVLRWGGRLPRFAAKSSAGPGVRAPGPLGTVLSLGASEGADFQHASLCASYLTRSLRLLWCTGIQAPGVGSTDPRGSDRPQSPSGPDPLTPGVADSARGRPPGLTPGAPDGATPPGAAPVAPVGPGPAGTGVALARWPRPQGGPPLGRGPALGSTPPSDGFRHSRAPDFELPESWGSEAPLESQLGRMQDRMWQWIWADDGGVRSTLRVRPPS